MNKTETSAAVVKLAYVRPRIACYAAEYSLCEISNHKDGGHNNAELDGSLDEQP